MKNFLILALSCLLALQVQAASIGGVTVATLVEATNIAIANERSPVLYSATATRIGNSPSIPIGLSGGTNDMAAVQEAHPVWVPERNRYEAVYTGWDGSASFLAVRSRTMGAWSANGTNWSKIKSTPIIPCGQSWDNKQSGSPCILNENGTNWVFYWGATNLWGGVPTTPRFGIGVAYSTDGTNYTEYSGNPLIPYDGTNSYAPAVTKQGNTYVMLYNHNSGSGPFGAFRATSSSLTGPWVNDAVNPVLRGQDSWTNFTENTAIVKLSDSNYWVVADNGNYIEDTGYRRGIPVWHTTNILTGGFDYTGLVLANTSVNAWDAQAAGAPGLGLLTNGSILLMYSANAFAIPTNGATYLMQIGSAILTPGFRPNISTNVSIIPNDGDWIRIAEGYLLWEGRIRVTGDFVDTEFFVSVRTDVEEATVHQIYFNGLEDFPVNVYVRAGHFAKDYVFVDILTDVAAAPYVTVVGKDAPPLLAPVKFSPTISGATILLTRTLPYVTPEEEGYLGGVTSPIQTQFAEKAPSASPTLTGVINLNGAVLANVRTVSASASVNASDCTIIADPSGSDIAVTLPAASAGNRILIVKNIDDSNSVIITAAGSDTIEGAASFPVGVGGECITIQSDGVSAWRVIGKFTP